MPSGSTFLLFAAASLGLLVVPGPAVLYIVTRSVEQGRQVGLASVLGVHIGTTVHILAAAAGLSALLVSSATAFSAVKYAGAAYLIVLGLRRLFGRRPAEQPQVRGNGVRQAFLQGIVVNVLNPKTALFFLAFLPPFLDPRRGPVFIQVILLGLTFMALGVLSDGSYAIAASAVAKRVRDRRKVLARGQRASGLVYIALGVLAAFSRGRAAPRAS